MYLPSSIYAVAVCAGLAEMHTRFRNLAELARQAGNPSIAYSESEQIDAHGWVLGTVCAIAAAGVFPFRPVPA